MFLHLSKNNQIAETLTNTMEWTNLLHFNIKTYVIEPHQIADGNV